MMELSRTPLLIAAEINGIKEQVRSTVAAGAMEIGKRLMEAKALLPHGEWKGWLEAHVSYSERTAQNMMQLYQEYKDAPQIGNLSYTKAVLLLGVPGQEREAFLSEHDAESMSTRELKSEIAALRQKTGEMQLTMDEMLAQAKEQRQELEKARAGVAMAREVKAADEQDKKQLRQEIQELNARDIEEKGRAAAEKKELQETIARLEGELKESGQPIIQQVAPPEMVAELEKLRAMATRGKEELEARAAFQGFQDAFARLDSALSALERADAGAGRRFRNAFIRGIEMMLEQMRDKNREKN